MKARPILFNGNMVRALLAGRKTQTRRVLAIQPSNRWQFGTFSKKGIMLGEITSPHPKKGRFGAFIRREIWANAGKFEHDVITCPFGKPGDLLWVRETWIQKGRYVMPAWPEAEPEDAVWSGSKNIHYSADGEGPDSREDGRVVWRKRPSIHMPRWASRLTLRITDVRVERLQEISEEDAKAEGIERSSWEYSIEPYRNYSEPKMAPGRNCSTARRSFNTLWESINGPESWSANPWVWVIEFEVIHANVDAVLKQEAA